MGLSTLPSNYREPVKKTELPRGFWEHMSLNYYGPTHRREILLVFVDVYSRFPLVRYVGNTQDSAAVRTLDTVLSEFGNEY